MAEKEVVKTRRVVIESGAVPRAGRPRMWAYGYADLAKLFGTTPRAIRARVERGTLDPASLASICRAWVKRTKGVEL